MDVRAGPQRRLSRFKVSVAFLYCFDFSAVSFGGGFALIKVWGFEDIGLEILGMLEI